MILVQGEIPIQWLCGPQHQDMGHGVMRGGQYHTSSREPCMHSHHQRKQVVQWISKEYQGTFTIGSCTLPPLSLVPSPSGAWE